MRPKPLTPAQAQLANRLAVSARTPSFEPATVQDVSGKAADGGILAVVLWRGVASAVPYLSSYTPVVNHTVLLLIVGPQVIILGRIAGTPTSPPVDDPDPLLP